MCCAPAPASSEDNPGLQQTVEPATPTAQILAQFVARGRCHAQIGAPRGVAVQAAGARRPKSSYRRRCADVRVRSADKRRTSNARTDTRIAVTGERRGSQSLAWGRYDHAMGEHITAGIDFEFCQEKRARCQPAFGLRSTE